MTRPARRHRERAIYVETLIRAPIDLVWDLTQDPLQHVRWDARFTSITPTRIREDGAQEFRYELDLKLFTIRGTGVSLGTRRGSREQRTSALAFDTAHPLSPIGAGRGYWRYVPTDGGVRFFTGYDYEPGWGPIGRILDPIITRPYIRWLTARSFDRLRIWAEEGVAPERLGWWRGLLPGRRSRPRARRCLLAPPRGRARVMDLAPEGLARLA